MLLEVVLLYMLQEAWIAEDVDQALLSGFFQPISLPVLNVVVC